MIRPALLILALSALATPAQALKMSVWDRELQTKLGDGESTGGMFTAQLVEDYQGPVVILFALSDDEKAKGTYPTLKTRYDGVLEGGQLSVQPGANAAMTLAKFLTLYRLKLNLQPAGESLSLPGLKTSGTPTPTQAPARQK
ncbi:hypothetical protein E7T09_16935 [Deinococcus sp. KSM4-11]|uniref:hypothetical protein n=1 Tax=Deinococcus sp. KSM4-11 TaxID=2568654 RepID=UPI0010A2B78C|nr:hypothetical protein [Deinococcus sp. KSM4-11]THF85190.1 hypothetical protein E7T09_16935 [Deinococcus sp. KSM4-11]